MTGFLFELSGLLRERSSRARTEAASATLRLLADLFALHFRADSETEPFGPFMVMGDRRTFALEDLTDNHIATLGVLTPRVRSAAARARLADVLWLRSNPQQRSRWAQDALGNYVSILPESDADWVGDGQEHVLRAIDIAKRLGKPGRTQLATVETHLITLSLRPMTSDTWLPLRASEVLLENRLGRSSAQGIADQLSKDAGLLEGTDRHRARSLASGAERWFRTLEKPERWACELVRIAELWLAEAGEKAVEGGSHLAASDHVENALKSLRRIPRAQRDSLAVHDRIERAKALLSAYSARGLEEMVKFETEPIDLTEAATEAVSRVTGKEPGPALAAFCALAPYASASDTRSAAEESIREHPLSHMFPKKQYSADGRLVYSSPAPDASDPNSHAEAVRAEMIHQNGFRVQVIATGLLLPALDTIRSEHLLREMDFLAICRLSSIVPADRERLIARGLFAGFERDFGTALHLLAPQLENLIRQHLKSAGVTTTSLDLDAGVENEIGLSSLMEKSEAEAVFGADICFEIGALFSDALGFNFRNLIAHGLVPDSVAFSTSSLYAWWFMLRLVYLPFWNRLVAKEHDEDSEPTG